MAKANITVMRCDRCGGVEECRRVEQEYAWGRILASEANGPFKIGAPTHKMVFPENGKDICPDCIKSLRDWWHTLAAPTPDQTNEVTHG